MKRTLHICILFLVSFSLNAIQLPGNFVATYKMEKYGTTIGQMQLSLNKEGSNITYQSHSKPKGLAALLTDERSTETSKMLWSDEDNSARLSSYQYNRKNKTKNNQQIYLNWQDKDHATAKIHYAGKSFDLKTENAVWDRLSVQLALASDLKASTEVNKFYRYNILDKGQLNEFTFEYQKNEALSIGNNKYNTIKIKRPHGNRITYFWFAKGLDFIPVKVEQYKKGELHLSMELGSIDFTKE